MPEHNMIDRGWARRTFILYYIGAVIAVSVISYVLETFAEIDAPSGLGVAGLFAAVFGVGTQIGTRVLEMPRKSTLWGMAAEFTAIAFVISVLLLGVILFTLAPAHERGFLFQRLLADIPIYAVVTLVLVLICVFGARFALSTAIKNGLKIR